MSDIFISYANKDRDRASRLAEALRSEGWSVFSDRTIPPGQGWREFIGAELAKAHCVLVAWSEASVESQWVQEEADNGKERGLLVPVLFDDVRPPLGFSHIEAANLVDWNGTPDAPDYQQLLNAISHVLGPPKKRKTADTPKSEESITEATVPPAVSASRTEEGPVPAARAKHAQEPSVAGEIPRQKAATPRRRWREMIGRAAQWTAIAATLALGLYASFTLARLGLVSMGPQQVKAPVCVSLAGRGPEMMRLPGGEFEMGDRQGDGDPDERPVRTVSIRPFAVGLCEVTIEEYDRFAEATGREKAEDWGWGRSRRPVINVSWEAAAAYAEWLSEQTGKRYRLPSEAEWEYAARAGTTTSYWWGDEVGENRANCYVCGSQWDGRQTAPVGSFEPNPFGLHDTAGNVYEWVQDCWHDSYEGAPTDGSAWGEENGGDCSQRVIRGGSWFDFPRDVRSANRTGTTPDYGFNGVGFRLAQDIK